MSAPSSQPTIKIGALAPLTPPGWVEAGQQLLAGLELGVSLINESGGVDGRPLDLIIQDTAADPARALAAIDEFEQQGALAVVGEYHSIVARVAAGRCETLGLPFLCSSAVLDELTEQPSEWVARIAPAQSHGWRIYGDYLTGAGHTKIAAIVQPSPYWAAGLRILHKHLTPRGGAIVEFDVQTLPPRALCDALVETRATALLLLTAFPEPAVSIVKAVRQDPRLRGVVIGAPAGQPEFAEWQAALGEAGTGVPFLRYLPNALTSRGIQVGAALSDRLACQPSFIAFEGFDTISVLAELVSIDGATRAGIRSAFPHVCVDGTRGRIHFSRLSRVSIWQWAWPPVQVVDRDPAEGTAFRVRHRS